MTENKFREGDLCSVESGDGTYGVVKILKLELEIVHIRLYRNKFEERPRAIDPATLELGTIYDDSFGIGHLPLGAREFDAWAPRVLAHAAVEAEELEGYEMWREAADGGEGGVFGAPAAPPEAPGSDSRFARLRRAFRGVRRG